MTAIGALVASAWRKASKHGPLLREHVDVFLSFNCRNGRSPKVTLFLFFAYSAVEIGPSVVKIRAPVDARVSSKSKMYARDMSATGGGDLSDASCIWLSCCVNIQRMIRESKTESTAIACQHLWEHVSTGGQLRPVDADLIAEGHQVRAHAEAERAHQVIRATVPLLHRFGGVYLSQPGQSPIAVLLLCTPMADPDDEDAHAYTASVIRPTVDEEEEEETDIICTSKGDSALALAASYSAHFPDATVAVSTDSDLMPDPVMIGCKGDESSFGYLSAGHFASLGTERLEVRVIRARSEAVEEKSVVEE